MYESEHNLKRFEISTKIESDGLPEIISLYEMDERINAQFGSFENYRESYGEAISEEFRRSVANHYSKYKSDNTPVYVFESLDGYHAINATFRGARMPKPSFILDDGILVDALMEHPERLAINTGWMPIGFEPSPVIVVIDGIRNEIASKFLNILERAKIRFYVQDVDEVRDLIYSYTPDQIEKEIIDQRSQDYESNEIYERTLALWLI